MVQNKNKRPRCIRVGNGPTAEIDFLNFLQIEGAFLKTNYITSNYLPIPIDGRDKSNLKGETSKCLLHITILISSV